MRLRRALALGVAVAALIGSTAAAKPMRVMSINQCADQILLAILPPSRIASVTWLSRAPGGSLMAAAAARVAVNHGQAEEVVRARPDLIIAGAYTTLATRGLLKRMRYPLIEIGATDSFADIRRETRAIAAAVGQSARGEALIAHMDAALARLARDRGPQIRVAAWDGAGFSARPGSLYDAILTIAGAHNVIDEAGMPQSGADAETLLAKAPALLVRGAPGLEDGERRGETRDHPLIRRYWHDRTVIVPQAYYVCGTPFSADAALALRGQLRRAERAAHTPLPFSAR